jgi:hypothetical protein
MHLTFTLKRSPYFFFQVDLHLEKIKQDEKT